MASVKIWNQLPSDTDLAVYLNVQLLFFALLLSATSATHFSCL